MFAYCCATICNEVTFTRDTVRARARARVCCLFCREDIPTAASLEKGTKHSMMSFTQHPFCQTVGLRLQLFAPWHILQPEQQNTPRIFGFSTTETSIFFHCFFFFLQQRIFNRGCVAPRQSMEGLQIGHEIDFFSFSKFCKSLNPAYCRD